MRGYPQFSFWISIALVKIYFSCIIINRVKNTFELVGTVLKSACYLSGQKSITHGCPGGKHHLPFEQTSAVKENHLPFFMHQPKKDEQDARWQRENEKERSLSGRVYAACE